MRIFGHELLNIPSQSSFLKSRDVDLVLDVGANRGQYASGLRREGYRGRIHSFEPVSTAFAKLARLASGDRQWETFNHAVGAEPGTAEIQVSKNSVYSSIQPHTDMIADFSYKSAVVSTEQVEVKTLESYASDPAERIFLKIDTQGFERNVLDGARPIMGKVVGIQLELPIEHLYEGVWSFREAIDYMDDLGFTPAQFRQVNPIHNDKACAIEFDCIFKRKV